VCGDGDLVDWLCQRRDARLSPNEPTDSTTAILGAANAGGIMTDPIVELLGQQFTAMDALAADFSDDDWVTPTDLPGWTVKDCYSHVIGTESILLGDPSPEVDLSGLDHLTAPSSAMTEPAVHARRDNSGAEILAEFKTVIPRRMAELNGFPDERFDEVGFTPAGKAPYRDFMKIRAFDCWMHEQDVRRALDRPGHTDGPVAEHAMGRCSMAAGFVVGKKAGAPDGSSVVFDITGPMARQIVVVVDGRAKVVDDVPADPTATLTMDQETYWCLGGGRWEPTETLAAGRIEFAGDKELGEAVVQAMNFMI
jgi:uncharacterized protein (TIGR03083 family)